MASSQPTSAEQMHAELRYLQYQLAKLSFFPHHDAQRQTIQQRIYILEAQLGLPRGSVVARFPSPSSFDSIVSMADPGSTAFVPPTTHQRLQSFVGPGRNRSARHEVPTLQLPQRQQSRDGGTTFDTSTYSLQSPAGLTTSTHPSPSPHETAPVTPASVGPVEFPAENLEVARAMFAADNDDVVPIDEQELNEKLYHHMVREREQEQRWEQERRDYELAQRIQHGGSAAHGQPASSRPESRSAPLPLVTVDTPSASSGEPLSRQPSGSEFANDASAIHQAPARQDSSARFSMPGAWDYPNYSTPPRAIPPTPAAAPVRSDHDILRASFVPRPRFFVHGGHSQPNVAGPSSSATAFTPGTRPGFGATATGMPYSQSLVPHVGHTQAAALAAAHARLRDSLVVPPSPFQVGPAPTSGGQHLPAPIGGTSGFGRAPARLHLTSDADAYHSSMLLRTHGAGAIDQPGAVAGPVGKGSSQQAREHRNPKTDDQTKQAQEMRSLLDIIGAETELAPEDREATPPQMMTTLLEHQKVALTWMRRMEESSNGGGILADGMGLGKTIEMLALIVARRSSDTQCKTTLVVAPVALMYQWEAEVQTHLRADSPLSTYILHGTKRVASWKDLCRYDVVLTTYGMLASEYKNLQEWRTTKAQQAVPDEEAPNLPLLGPDSKWYRVVLDEAHSIRNRLTKGAQGAFALRSDKRWCLTGTPMMNDVGDLQALIEFLRIKPFDDPNTFKHKIARPFKGKDQDKRTKALPRLQTLLKGVMLRRSKRSQIDGRPIVELPARTDEVIYAVFDQHEEAFYRALEAKMKHQVSGYMDAGTLGQNFSNVLTMLMRLRQACCHRQLLTDLVVDPTLPPEVFDPTLVALAHQLAPEVVERIRSLEAFVCSVCYDAVENPAILLPCGHDMCSDCFTKISDQAGAQAIAEGSEAAGNARCPQCRGNISAEKMIDYRTFRHVHMGTDHEESTGHMQEDDYKDDRGHDEEADVNSDKEQSDNDDLFADENNADKADVEGESDDDDESQFSGDEHDVGRNPWGKVASQTSKKRKRCDGGWKPSKRTISGEGLSTGKTSKSNKAKGKERATTSSMSTSQHQSLAELKKQASRNADSHQAYIRRLQQDWKPSAKVDMCCQILEGVVNDTEEKIIIFSQFTTLLDLLEVPITGRGWGFIRYDGSMTAKARNEAVLRFRDPANTTCRIMLISIKAGNSGLNLIAASQVIIMDPFWNPFIEEQAIDRTHRFGQRKDVKVHRILTKNTVEDRIVAIQNTKKETVNNALDENASAKIGKLGTQQLAYLFGFGEN